MSTKEMKIYNAHTLEGAADKIVNEWSDWKSKVIKVTLKSFEMTPDPYSPNSYEYTFIVEFQENT